MPKPLIIIANLCLVYVYLSLPILYRRYVNKINIRLYVPKWCEYVGWFFAVISALAAIMRIHNLYNQSWNLSFIVGILAITASLVMAISMPFLFYYVNRPINKVIEHLETVQDAIDKDLFPEARKEIILAMSFLKSLEKQAKEVEAKLKDMEKDNGLKQGN